VPSIVRELQEPYASQSLADASLLYAKAGVQFPPGTKWQYSQTGINTAARIVEVISGLTFDEYASRFLFDPLGMKNTGFYLCCRAGFASGDHLQPDF
jgi:CubicO group peptidase (beta-lactamase class C family)